MQYLEKYLKAAKSGRFSDPKTLLDGRQVLEFYKVEFKNLDPCLWEKEGLKTLRDVQRRDEMDRRKANLEKFSMLHNYVYGEKNDQDNEDEKEQEEQEELRLIIVL
jgi:hypothetical protein